ncbi:MAG: P-II family nitrogen regulator [Eubacteriales bacterium]|nr:P-II family nitrogen regulator [Eubacteriales bacterium]MDD4327869.1 P-II family nitrogen regulator [Eubacteriales bacterium]
MDERYMLVYVIVECGLGSKVLGIARKSGIKGGTVIIAKGTARDSISRFLGLDETRREVVFLVSEKDTAEKSLIELNEKMKFEKPGHGIAFALPVCSTEGSSALKCVNICRRQEVYEVMHKLITVIVDKGQCEDAMEAALEAGAMGGTIVNARGSGIHETSRLFAMDIEPEKEMLMIIADTDSTDGIVDSIYRNMKMDEPGNGIIYVQNVVAAYGLAK